MPTGRRTKLLTLALWIVIVAGLSPLALKLTEVQNNDTLGSLPASAEASRAAARTAAAFPEPDGLVAVAVYVRESGLTAADRAKVDADRAAFAAYARGGSVPAPAPAADGQALLVSFPLAGDDVAGVRRQLAAQAPDGLRTALTGSAGAEDDLSEAFSGLDVTLLLATVAAVALLLLLTYRSPVLWLIPLLTAGIASQCAGGVVYLLVEHAGLSVDLQSQNIMTILAIGVGVDYALLLISRYREELRRHEDRHEAMAVALRRSFPAVCASAITVAIGLLCLLAADLPATHGLGPVGAIAVVATLAAMTTLLPTLLVLLGRWVFWPFVPRYGAAPASASPVSASPASGGHGVWARIARFVGARPRTIWLVTAVVLAGLTMGIGRLSVGLPGDETFTREVGSITGQHLIERHYPGGTLAPAVITATADTAGPVAGAARGVDGVARVGEPQRSADGRWVRIDATLAAEATSPEAVAALGRLRTAVRSVPGADALVGGDTALEADGAAVTARDNRVVVPLVLAVVLLVLIVLLRALVAPLVLMASVVLSYGAALGGAGLILDAMGHPRLWSAVPLQTFLFIVALGVDYTIFLMTRAREETARLGHRPGVLHALTVTGGVITSAGVVLAATFAALTVLPMVPSVQIGVIVAAGVLIDTLLVRSLLVPALTLHIGRRAWWPATP